MAVAVNEHHHRRPYTIILGVLLLATLPCQYSLPSTPVAGRFSGRPPWSSHTWSRGHPNGDGDDVDRWDGIVGIRTAAPTTPTTTTRADGGDGGGVVGLSTFGAGGAWRSLLVGATGVDPLSPSSIAGKGAGKGQLQKGGGGAKGLLKKGLLGLGAVLVATVLGSPGLRRQSQFWIRAFPVYLQYRLTGMIMDARGMHQDDQNVVWERLHQRHVGGMLAMVRRLKGYFIKICQLSSARVDLLPMIWVENFSTLQDAVPPKPGHEIIRIVEQSYGKKIDEVFEEFDADRPLGSASIGQCHVARLKGSGKLVAVKVMYPEAESVFWSDMKTLRQFAALAQPAYVAMLDEVQRQFSKEFDYIREARDQEAVRKGLLQAGFKKAVVVPEAYLPLCTREVLVMEFIPGTKLINAVASPPSSSSHDGGGGGGGWLTPWRWSTFRAWKQSYTKRYAHWLVDSVVHVHGHQILMMGRFNGDPHPGNILLTPDGRLGLIDYGQIKVLGVKQRRTLAKLIIALADGDEKSVVDLFVRMGFRSKRMDPEVIAKVATIYFDRDDASLTKGVRLQVFFERLQEQDPFTSAPEDYIMAARVALFMRGLGTFLHHPISIAKAWKPLALQCLKELPADDQDE